MADVLQDAGRRSWVIEQQLLVSAFQSHEAWRINTVCEIQPNRTHRRPVANAEPGGVDHIIEIRQTFLAYPKRDFAETRINVSHVMKDHAVDVVPNQWESQFRRV